MTTLSGFERDSAAAGRLPRRWRVPLADRSRVSYVLGAVALGALYYGAAKLGFALDFAGPVAAVVWLPCGVGIAGLAVAGLRFWPGVLVADLLVNDYAAVPVGSALGQTCGNMVEILLAALLIRRLLQRGPPLDSVASLGRLLLIIVGATLVSATVGTFSLWLGDVVASAHVSSVWRTWWLGDAAGALVVVPLVLAWYRKPPPGWWRGSELEALLLLIAVVVLGELALRSHRPLVYLVFPPLAWAALRFGPRGATVALTVAVGLAVWNTTHYFGPFAFESITSSVLSTQLFIAVATLSTLALAAVVSEREAFAAGLRASRARLVEAGDAERRRLEHNLHDGAQQRLTALAYHLRLGAERARANPEHAGDLFADAEAELLVAIDELRKLAHGLRPAELAAGGLDTALVGLASRSPIPVMVLGLPGKRLGPTVEATAFYVAAETITNAHRYSGASSIEVRADVVHGALVLGVADDGAGGAVERAGSGLEGLRDRVEAIGGSFRLWSPAGQGTQVVATIPLGPPERFTPPAPVRAVAHQ